MSTTPRFQFRPPLDGLGVVAFARLCLQEPDETNYAEEPFVPYEPALQALAAGRRLDLRLRHFPIQDRGTPTPQMRLAVARALIEARYGPLDTLMAPMAQESVKWS